MRRALVSGATGYVGARLTRSLLEAGCEVHVLARPGSDLTRLPSGTIVHVTPGDSWPKLRDTLADISPQVLFHLAADARPPEPDTGPDPQIEANLALGTRLCEALSLAGNALFINIGSFWEYAPDGSYAPLTLYAALKRAMRDVIEHYRLTNRLRAITLILFDVYGPNDWRGKFLPGLISALKDGRPLPATAGEQLMDLVHIEDVVRGIMLAAKHSPPAGQATYALDSGERVSLRRLAEIVESLAGRKANLHWGARPYPASQIFHPVSGLPRLPGWKPEIILEDGLKALLTEDEFGLGGRS